MNDKDKYAFEKTTGKQATLYFPTAEAAAVWKADVVGQISDGMWENTVNSGWVFWVNANVAVDPGVNRVDGFIPGHVKRNFAFTRLMGYIGDEICATIHQLRPELVDAQLQKRAREVLGEISRTVKGA